MVLSWPGFYSLCPFFKEQHFCCSSGGDERDRTDDPLLAKQVLSQLSYTPIFRDIFPIHLSLRFPFLQQDFASIYLISKNRVWTRRLAPWTLKIKQRVSFVPLTLDFALTLV